MKLVVIESPYAGDVEKNLAYVRACMAHCLRMGEAPFASHVLYTQPGVLDDTVPEERKLGIEAGFAWGEVHDGARDFVEKVFYVDLGWSRGMLAALARYRNDQVPVRVRRIGSQWGPGAPCDYAPGGKEVDEILRAGKG